MKVLLLSRYGDRGASSRVRFLQYLQYLEAEGISFQIEPLFSNKYLESLYSGRRALREIVKGYLWRMAVLSRARRFDLLIFEKELFPFLPPIAEKLLKLFGIPYLVDYDDALFHRYDLHRRWLVKRLFGQKIDSVMRHASIVVAGNHYLAERARRAGTRDLVVIPTVVDTDRYQAVPKHSTQGTVVVGWIGTPKTSRYLVPLLPAFKRLQTVYNVRFVAVGPNRSDLPDASLDVWEWSEETEVQSIQQFDVGIMPLEDSPWERGKCGYKLIQYMACGLPVIASPVGVNQKLVKTGINGFLADSEGAWESALEKVISMSPQDRSLMGARGRYQVEKMYSLKAQAPRLLSAIRQALN